MNYTKILNHKIIWFLRESESLVLNNSWQEKIVGFIINEYMEGEFAVEINNSTDSLIWKIEK